MPDKRHPGLSPGQQEFDNMHLELEDMVHAALQLPASEMAAAYRNVVATVEADFRYEEALMESFQCADAHQHREQHARMQAGLHHAAAALDRGDTLPAQQALVALRDWLGFHGETQDRHLQRMLQRSPPH